MKQITWENGQFVDINQTPMKVEPIGIPQVFGNLGDSMTIDHTMDGKEFEAEVIRRYLDKHEDVSYRQANAYVVGYCRVSRAKIHKPVTFYKIIS